MGSIILYRLIIDVYEVESWNKWIVYAIIDSCITAFIVCSVNFITEPKLFKDCMNMVVKKIRKM